MITGQRLLDGNRDSFAFWSNSSYPTSFCFCLSCSFKVQLYAPFAEAILRDMRVDEHL